jgi:hypothetical protein
MSDLTPVLAELNLLELVIEALPATMLVWIGLLGLRFGHSRFTRTATTQIFAVLFTSWLVVLGLVRWAFSASTMLYLGLLALAGALFWLSAVAFGRKELPTPVASERMSNAIENRDESTVQSPVTELNQRKAIKLEGDNTQQADRFVKTRNLVFPGVRLRLGC